jgi:hypothetical protein
MPADGQWNLAQWNFGELWRIGNKGIKQRVLCGGTLGVFEPGAKEQHAVKDGPGISVPDTISRDHKPEEDRRAVHRSCRLRTCRSRISRRVRPVPGPLPRLW